MRRLCFNYLVNEISAAVGQSIRRYPLWMRLHELGWDPETLGRAAPAQRLRIPARAAPSPQAAGGGGRLRRRHGRDGRRVG